jgi:2-oxoacid:acceptor oxidoreductase gamma subunit (pyruvate/2-ketoisovalerate family)
VPDRQTVRLVDGAPVKEIKFFGRGGQGAVTAAQILATAAFLEKKCAQTFPHFGAERRGAPVLAYVRIDDQPITLRSKIYEPDVVIVLDLNLLKMLNPFEGLKPNGSIILNHSPSPSHLPSVFNDPSVSVHVIDASPIAQEIYGKTPIPIVNVIVLGAYCRALGDIQLTSVYEALSDFFPRDKVDLNRRAAQLGYERLRGMSWPNPKS